MHPTNQGPVSKRKGPWWPSRDRQQQQQQKIKVKKQKKNPKRKKKQDHVIQNLFAKSRGHFQVVQSDGFVDFTIVRGVRRWIRSKLFFSPIRTLFFCFRLFMTPCCALCRNKVRLRVGIGVFFVIFFFGFFFRGNPVFANGLAVSEKRRERSAVLWIFFFSRALWCVHILLPASNSAREGPPLLPDPHPCFRRKTVISLRGRRRNNFESFHSIRYEFASQNPTKMRPSSL